MKLRVILILGLLLILRQASAGCKDKYPIFVCPGQGVPNFAEDPEGVCSVTCVYKGETHNIQLTYS